MIGTIRRVSDIDLNDPAYMRAGIIPVYTAEDGTNYYAFGLSRNAAIFDFGGHMEPGENPIQAAVRELLEETYNVFNHHITVESILENDYEVIDGLNELNRAGERIGSLDILIPVNVNMLKIMLDFKNIIDSIDESEDVEIVRIIWIRHDHLCKIYRLEHPIRYCGSLPFYTYYRIQHGLQRWVRECN